MDWRLEGFRLGLVFPYSEQPIQVMAAIFGLLDQYGDPYIPTDAYTVDSDHRIRSILVDLCDPRSVTRLGARVMDERHNEYRDVRVTLTACGQADIDLCLCQDRKWLLDVLQISVHRACLKTEADAQQLLALACDLRRVLRPVIGDIVDYEVEGKNPVPFEYHRNSHSLPERIHWADFWGPAVVGRLGGLERVRTAPAYQVHEESDGSVLVLSTPTLLTYSTVEDTARRQAIWEWLGLERLHEQFGRESDEQSRRRPETRATGC